MRDLNPFGGGQSGGAMTRPQPTAMAAAHTDQQRAMAEVQAAMMLARANPRDERRAMSRILDACKRKTLATTAIYEYARGGTDISGPSIRLAEAIAQQWGNISWGLRELDQEPGLSTIQAYAWDMETNTRREVVFQVPHMRYTKRGTQKLEDPRDIYELVANNGMRRVRACLLGVIPGDVVEAAREACEITILEAAREEGTVGSAKLLEAFSRFGVTQAMIEKRIQRDIGAITPNQTLQLRKIYASLKDGMSTVENWFEVPTEPDATDAPPVSDKLTPQEQEAAKRAAGFPGYDKPYSAQREGLLSEKEFARAGGEPGEPGGPELDVNGTPYNPEFHSGGDKRKNDDGSWRMKRGYDPERYKAWLATTQADPKGREDSVAWYCDAAEEAESIERVRELKSIAMKSGLDESALNTVLDVLDARMDEISSTSTPTQQGE